MLTFSKIFIYFRNEKAEEIDVKLIPIDIVFNVYLRKLLNK